MYRKPLKRCPYSTTRPFTVNTNLHSNMTSSKLFNKGSLQPITVKHYILQGGSRLPRGSLHCFPCLRQFQVTTRAFGSDLSLCCVVFTEPVYTGSSREQRSASVPTVPSGAAFFATTNNYSRALTNSI